MGPLVRLLALSLDEHALINTLAMTKRVTTARFIGTSRDCPTGAAIARRRCELWRSRCIARGAVLGRCSVRARREVYVLVSRFDGFVQTATMSTRSSIPMRSFALRVYSRAPCACAVAAMRRSMTRARGCRPA
jgi:hypothetical protein